MCILLGSPIFYHNKCFVIYIQLSIFKKIYPGNSMAELQGPRQISLAAEGSIPSRGPTTYYIINQLSE